MERGFQSQLLEVGTLKDSEEFDLKNIEIKPEFNLCLRFHTFKDALQAYEALESKVDFKLSAARSHDEGNHEFVDQSELVDSAASPFMVKFVYPEPIFYDGWFATHFENCVKDKFVGLNSIVEVPSDYVSQGLRR